MPKPPILKAPSLSESQKELFEPIFGLSTIMLNQGILKRLIKEVGEDSLIEIIDKVRKMKDNGYEFLPGCNTPQDFEKNLGKFEDAHKRFISSKRELLSMNHLDLKVLVPLIGPIGDSSKIDYREASSIIYLFKKYPSRVIKRKVDLAVEIRKNKWSPILSNVKTLINNWSSIDWMAEKFEIKGFNNKKFEVEVSNIIKAMYSLTGKSSKDQYLEEELARESCFIFGERAVLSAINFCIKNKYDPLFIQIDGMHDLIEKWDMLVKLFTHSKKQ
jgi:hypothetical protein